MKLTLPGPWQIDRLRQAILLQGVKIAVVDQAVRVPGDRHHLIHIQELAVVNAEVLAVPADHDLAGPHSGVGKPGSVEGNPGDPEGFSFHSVDHERLVSRGPACISANDRLIDSGPLDGDGLHLGPMAGVPSLRPHRRAGGKLHDVAVLGRVDRIPDGLRRQVGGHAGLGTNGVGQQTIAATRKDNANNNRNRGVLIFVTVFPFQRPLHVFGHIAQTILM